MLALAFVPPLTLLGSDRYDPLTFVVARRLKPSSLLITINCMTHEQHCHPQVGTLNKECNGFLAYVDPNALLHLPISPSVGARPRERQKSPFLSLLTKSNRQKMVTMKKIRKRSP
jgi:hypothetical protein